MLYRNRLLPGPFLANKNEKCVPLRAMSIMVKTSEVLEDSREIGNDQEPIQSNSTSYPKHQTGKEHLQLNVKTVTNLKNIQLQEP